MARSWGSCGNTLEITSLIILYSETWPCNQVFLPLVRRWNILELTVRLLSTSNLQQTVEHSNALHEVVRPDQVRSVSGQYCNHRPMSRYTL